ncbi:HEAT repeat domain-containing protein [Halorientalis salina]|uniref:HEAT repeat domain-containing protein n=1 Tax=Halorientalis salina TaxID=2932266 RepID=UPI0010ABF95B|nr:HEAT repeat domain-containing protein [Halorientalis salina]
MSDNRKRWDSSAIHQLSGDVDTDELYKRLEYSETVETRRRTAELLGNLADTDLEYEEATLVQNLTNAVLTDDDVAVRARAINALYFHGDEYITELINEVAKSVRDGERTDDVTQFFLGWLDAEYPEFRMVAASALRRFGDERVVPSLRNVFDDTDARVRARAVRSYSLVDGSVRVEPIQSMLRDSAPRVRRAAATALGRIGTEDAVEGLVPAARASDEQLRRIAVEHLYQLDTERAAKVLLQALSDRSRTVRSEALESLLRLVATGDSVRAAAVRDALIEDTGTPEPTDIVDVLRDVLARADRNDVRCHAVWLLGEFVGAVAGGDVRNALVERLDDGDPVVADIAAAYLRQLEGEALEKRLRRLVQSDDTSLDGKERAASILEKIENDTATRIEAMDIEYTYVSEPSDYTAKRTTDDVSE